MIAATGPSVSEVLPHEVWAELEASQDAALIDVRTHAEWSFVGTADLSGLGRSTILAEWRSYPDMAVVDSFADTVFEQLGADIPAKLFFICRSGVRSMQAARAMADALAAKNVSASCFNVAEGFEGDLNLEGKRGAANGWKARGLAWRQS